MPKSKSEIGSAGEDYTARLIEKRGMTILALNFHSRYGEIDIIAHDDEYICFIEVKTRKRSSMVSGEESVTTTKQRKIIKTALCWLDSNECDLQPRFDVCVVHTDSSGHIYSHDYYDGAFDATDFEL